MENGRIISELMSLRRLRNRLDELAGANPRTAAALESARELITQYQDAPTLVEVLLQTTRLAENEMTRSRLEADKPDLLIQPAVGDVATLDFTNAGDCIRAGYEAARAACGPFLPVASGREEIGRFGGKSL